MALSKGDAAPQFTLKDKDGVPHSLDDFSTKYLVLFFYPQDGSAECAMEAKKFDENQDEFRELNATVIGISDGDEKDKKEFIEQNNLSVLLLADKEAEIADKYGVYEKKEFMGHKFKGIKRTTYVLDDNRRIVKVYNDVKPGTHAQEIIKFLKNR